MSAQPAPYHHLNASPFPAHLCLACGCDPRDVWDDLGHFVVRRDEAARLDEHRHCAACATRRTRARVYDWQNLTRIKIGDPL